MFRNLLRFDCLYEFASPIDPYGIFPEEPFHDADCFLSSAVLMVSPA